MTMTVMPPSLSGKKNEQTKLMVPLHGLPIEIRLNKSDTLTAWSGTDLHVALRT